MKAFLMYFLTATLGCYILSTKVGGVLLHPITGNLGINTK